LLAAAMAAGLFAAAAPAATVQKHYYAYDAVHDAHGVIAPWYKGLNGPCDLRVRIAAETLKRYPWTTRDNAVAQYPHYVFSGYWAIKPDGTITPRDPGDSANADMGQRALSVLNGLVDYYRYSGDPAAVAHLTYMADYLLDHCQTPANHPWPGIFISVPGCGKAYYKADPHGLIQLDICAAAGQALLRAYQVTGNVRWLEAAKHWADLLAEHCNLDPKADPWPRYANFEDAKVAWKAGLTNKQTGGVTMILAFFDDLIRFGYTGRDGRLVKARDAGRRYLEERLLPVWWANPTWGHFFWDWENPVQNCWTTEDAARYLMDHPDAFLNWRCDARNILTLFLNHSGVNDDSRSDVFSGAWAYPEANNCCGRSLWYSPIVVAPAFAQYAVETGDPWAREMAYRQMVLQTYDIRETGVSEDGIDGGVAVNNEWFNIAHGFPLRFVLAAIGWLPEELGASRENHIVRSTAVVNSVVYGAGRVAYTTFDAPVGTTDVLRLSFAPQGVTADGWPLPEVEALKGNGYTLKKLPNGDAIVVIRHDGAKQIVVRGDDPQEVMAADKLTYEGKWQAVGVTEAAGATVTASFTGNQVRLIGRACPDGGLADVWLDGVKQLVFIDCWNPSPRDQQVLYYKNGLPAGRHVLKIAARGAGNPYAGGSRVYIEGVQFSAADKPYGYPVGGGPTATQRMVFGYVERTDYIDSQGHAWRPATEFIGRTGVDSDSVAGMWWLTAAANPIQGTADPELYRRGVHGHEFRVNVTVGPGTYYARLKFAAARGADTAKQCFDVLINGRKAVSRLSVAAKAGGPNRALDLVFNGIEPRNGIVEVRFLGKMTAEDHSPLGAQAFVQALEVGLGDGGPEALPLPATPPSANLLQNPIFEDTDRGITLNPNSRGSVAGWTYQTLPDGRDGCYFFPEWQYREHPDWGLPEFHGAGEALRTHTNGQGHTRIFQEVQVQPGTAYTASAWARAVDMRGKGFGKDPKDSAALVIEELDAQGKPILAHPRVEMKTAGPYRQLSRSLTTGTTTAGLRFILDTVISCPYAEGHVTYADCDLRMGNNSR
jgi:hypothetical protein